MFIQDFSDSNNHPFLPPGLTSDWCMRRLTNITFHNVFFVFFGFTVWNIPDI